MPTTSSPLPGDNTATITDDVIADLLITVACDTGDPAIEAALDTAANTL